MDKKYFIKGYRWVRIVMLLLSLVYAFFYISNAPYAAIAIVILLFVIEWLKYRRNPVTSLELFFEKTLISVKRKVKNDPVLHLTDKGITTRFDSFEYRNIESYTPARGGSEPYIILIDKEQIDIPISWLRKHERIEIETYLQKRINGKA